MNLAASWAEKRRAAGTVAPAPVLLLDVPARREPRRAAAVVPPVAEATSRAVKTGAAVRQAPRRSDRAAPKPTQPRPATHEESPKPRATHKDISAEQELDLIRRYQAGDRRAGDVLLQAHEPIIYGTVRHLFGKGLDVDDVLQAARMGFLRGIEKFDAARGNRLTTYATWWARTYAQNALIDEGTTIVVRRNVDNQIAEAKKRGEQIPERLLLQRQLRTIGRLDAPIGDEDDGATLGEMTAGADAGPEAALVDEDAQARRRELIGRAMTRLTPQEQEVVRRMVLADDPETLEEVGASYSRTRERIRQIKVKALEKLEMALRKLMADDDAVLWGAEPPAGPVRRRGAPLLPAPPAVDAAPVAHAAPASDPPRAKPIQRPMPAAPRPTVEQIASFRPLKPPQKRASLELA